MVVYACMVWVVAGAVQQQWWMQMACFGVSVFLMVVLNNSNALIRIYSRMVSCSFIALTCAATYLFPSLGGAIVGLCFIASLIIALHCYQDKQSAGWTFYSFLCLGMASMVFVQILYLVPVFWLLMAFQLFALSWRTFLASVVGLLTPYWMASCWLFWQQDWSLLTAHFMPLAQVTFPADYTHVTICQAALYAVVLLAAIIGTVHFYRQSFNDKIRIRQFYSCFITVVIAVLLLLALMPQHFDMLIRMAIVVTSPLIAHFIALTRTRVTNIAFFAIITVVLLLTVASLWIPSLTF